MKNREVYHKFYNSTVTTVSILGTLSSFTYLYICEKHTLQINGITNQIKCLGYFTNRVVIMDPLHEFQDWDSALALPLKRNAHKFTQVIKQSVTNTCRRPKRCGFDPWIGKIPWRRAQQPTLVSCLESPMDRRA